MYRPVPNTGKPKQMNWISDVFILGIFCIFLYFFVGLAQRVSSPLEQAAEIDLSLLSLPKYAFYSFIRAASAYIFSLMFTLSIGYAAAKSKTLERLILPLLDIGQSIPVLGFMPGLVLGLISLFPKSNFGLELSCILMIFTGQVWNMAFSYYASLKSVPTQFHELSSVIGLNTYQKLLNVELPYSATTLAWNSLMSMAGGWFFLIVCESFQLGSRTYRLPGLGSYMDMAMKSNNGLAMIAGVLAMIFVIVITDFLIWRPILSWSEKFRLEEAQDQTKDIPFVTLILRESQLIRKLTRYFTGGVHFVIAPKPEVVEDEKRAVSFVARLFNWMDEISAYIGKWRTHFRRWRNETPVVRDIGAKWIYFVAFVFVIAGALRVYELVRPLKHDMWISIFTGTGLTLLRVVSTLVLASLWAIPVGIWIGSSQKLVRIFQPIVQVAAAFPAPMLYPAVLIVLSMLGMTEIFGSVALMLLGVQWYILFNVLAGASTISKELRDSLNLIGASRWTTWRALYLPSVFPALVTGWVTAAGGAWNASVVSEFVEYNNKTLFVHGLGSLIKQSTDKGDFHMLTACLLVMCLTVVGMNRTLWRSLYRLAERRFKYER